MLVYSTDGIMNVRTRVIALWAPTRECESVLVDVQADFFGNASCGVMLYTFLQGCTPRMYHILGVQKMMVSKRSWQSYLAAMPERMLPSSS